MLTRDGEVKLVDFGVGTELAGRDKSGVMKSVIGTPMFMASEIHLCKPYIGSEVDIFALGMSLMNVRIKPQRWQDKPFDVASTEQDPRYKLYKFKKDKFWGRYQAIGITSELRDLIEKMTAHKPEARATMKDILDHPWLNGKTPT